MVIEIRKRYCTSFFIVLESKAKNTEEKNLMMSRELDSARRHSIDHEEGSLVKL